MTNAGLLAGESPLPQPAPPRPQFKWLAAKPDAGPLYPSPLRYPGAKRKLAPQVAQLLAINDLRPDLFVEPFAGGASVGLSLLWRDAVGAIGLVDCDPLVSSFWTVVFSDSEWLIEQVREVEISVAKWREMRAWHPNNDRGRALKCLYLNRTSFSGILHRRAGPIGGQEQNTAYKIDCRFNRDNLADRLAEVAGLSDRVRFIHNTDWQLALQWVEAYCGRGDLPSNIALYFDPPFFDKADRLYSHYFSEADHERLRDALIELDDVWILSYDRLDRVAELYGDIHGGPWAIDGEYTASAGGGRQATEALLTNLPKRPANPTGAAHGD
jgi:DNA adenine methylase